MQNAKHTLARKSANLEAESISDSASRFPFPTRELALKELSWDRYVMRIPEEDKKRIVDLAWSKGECAAHMVFEESNGQSDFFQICKDAGMTIIKKDIDCVYGNQRYFSDYVSGTKEITLYEQSCALWAKQNQLDLHEAQNLILMHEFFHVLETTRLGLTSKEYTVPLFTIGPFKLGKTGIHALSEIAAHAFTNTYYGLLNSSSGLNSVSDTGGSNDS
ncbi:hypothetical protein [Lancefieldella parvula]|uniref:Uncharacterized protein n=1 Tax=Lancefieldella parvula (strain ATCC 33793 / DSM 20469 / CCUG 32760 / JCM 10300 / KCTC 3663 / VPI 0546 / 1246) TaxID=521095 RepID=C8W910_LANP1|nr:hypothetical protein [Lancefieldella parvula]ACV50598.1 hypothetical protein Apar_0162 [Lancefieldella parvula DSM 20469]MDU4868639.1 hypothetical protein [Lancefieldella parvula]